MFGKVPSIEDREEMFEVLKNFALKILSKELVHREIKATGHAVQMYEIEIERLAKMQERNKETCIHKTI